MTLLKAIRQLPQTMRNPFALRQSRRADELTVAIRRERTRADRNGGEFSLLTFTARKSFLRGHGLERVAQYLARRVRMIDQHGFTPDHRLWLVLTDCPGDAAVRMANDICGRFSTPRTRISYHLFHYTAISGASSDRRGQHRQEPSRDSHDSNDSSPTEINRLASAAQMGESPLVQSTPHWKQSMDAVLSAVALVGLVPLFVLAAILVKLSSKGPIFFVQMRVGRSGKPFRMYKFRTMTVDAERRKLELLSQNEQDGPAFKMENDPRVTWIGRFLRATSIDELPQLWNVLCGQMSLVGPRPLPVNESEACESWQLERLDVTPGLTCLWQICDRRSKIPFAEWMRMDVRYVRTRSLMLDLRLIAQTLAVVIRRKGV